MALKLNGKAHISTEKKASGKTVLEDHKEEQVASLEAMATPDAEVGFEASYTHNLGNYESIRVGVFVRLKCDKADIDEVYAFAKDWADTKLTQAVEEVKS